TVLPTQLRRSCNHHPAIEEDGWRAHRVDDQTLDAIDTQAHEVRTDLRAAHDEGQRVGRSGMNLREYLARTENHGRALVWPHLRTAVQFDRRVAVGVEGSCER